MSEQRKPPTLEQQADMVSYLIGRAKMCDGSDAGRALMLIEKQDMDDLRLLAERLRRMVPHEAAIKRVVMGR